MCFLVNKIVEFKLVRIFSFSALIWLISFNYSGVGHLKFFFVFAQNKTFVGEPPILQPQQSGVEEESDSDASSVYAGMPRVQAPTTVHDELGTLNWEKQKFSYSLFKIFWKTVSTGVYKKYLSWLKYI